MAYSNNDEKIKKYIDELADEYKVLLYKKLIEDNRGHDDLSISELLRLDAEVKKPLLDKRRDKRKRMSYMIVFTGMVYAFAGMGIFLFYFLRERMYFGGIELVSLAIAFTGILISSMSMIIPQIMPTRPYSQTKYSRKEKSEQSLIEHNIISIWRDIEGITSELTDIKTAVRKSSPIDTLEANGLITKTDDVGTLRKLLSLRNKVVHHSIENVDYDEAAEIIEKCAVIIETLKKII